MLRIHLKASFVSLQVDSKDAFRWFFDITVFKMAVTDPPEGIFCVPSGGFKR
jgi:hypothetical protein